MRIKLRRLRRILKEEVALVKESGEYGGTAPLPPGSRERYEEYLAQADCQTCHDTEFVDCSMCQGSRGDGDGGECLACQGAGSEVCPNCVELS